MPPKDVADEQQTDSCDVKAVGPVLPPKDVSVVSAPQCFHMPVSAPQCQSQKKWKTASGRDARTQDQKRTSSCQSRCQRQKKWKTASGRDARTQDQRIMSNCQEARGGGEPHIGDGLSCVLRLEDSRGAKMKTAFASHEAREVMQPVFRMLGGAPKTASKMNQRQRSRSAAAKRATEDTECGDCKGEVTSTAQIALQSKIKDIDRQLQEALGFGIGHREEEVEEMLLGLALAARACSDCKSECSTLAGRPCATVSSVRERLDTAMTRAKCMQLIQDSNVCIMMHTCTARAGCVHMQEFVQTHQVKIIAR